MPIETRLITVTQGNIDHHHFYLTEVLEIFPADVIGGTDQSHSAPRAVRIQCGDEIIETDIDKSKNIFRKRGWITKFFDSCRIQVGDQLLLEQLDPYLYRVSKA